MPIHIRLLLVLLFWLGASSFSRAQGPLRFHVETLGAAHPSVALAALDAAGALEIEEAGGRRKLPAFIELRQENRKLPALPSRNFVLLTNGDRVPLDPEASASLAENRLQVWPAASLPSLRAKGLNLFAPNVVLLFWSLPEGADDADLFFAELEKQPRKRDAVYLKNGDRIEGTLVALDAKTGCTIATAARKVQTPWSQLAGIAWNTDRQARLRTKKTYSRAVLDGGARVNFLEVRFEEKTRGWLGKTQFGSTLELPEASLLALDVRQGPAVDLSDLTPVRYEHRPYLGAAWPLVKDAAADNHPLRLFGSTYEKGLGTHAPCRVTYALDGKYQRFDAIVGIDSVTSRRGRAKAAVEIDGNRSELNGGKELTSETAPVEMRLNVAGARTLTLIVELGAFGDVQANVNWAKARLVRSPWSVVQNRQRNEPWTTD